MFGFLSRTCENVNTSVALEIVSPTKAHKSLRSPTPRHSGPLIQDYEDLEVRRADITLK